MHPNQLPVERLSAGQVGYIVCGMKRSSEAHIGDTFYLNGKEVDPLPGFEELKPMVTTRIRKCFLRRSLSALFRWIQRNSIRWQTALKSLHSMTAV